MSKNQGSALLWLLYTVAIFTLLSSSLLKLALSDLRVSGHLINAERAQYAAEAGIEYAVAVLPWRWRELAAGSWQYERQEEPCFTVSAQRENSSLLRIHAQGRAGGMVRDVEVLASLRPFARQALIARQLWGQAITVVGHVAADEVVFRTDSSYIDGDLRAARLELQDGGSYHCTGYHWTQGRPYTLEVDFPLLVQEAVLQGWSEAEDVAGVYLVDGERPGPLLAPGKVEIDLQTPWEGLLVALDEVKLLTWAPGSQIVLLAAEEVELNAVGEVWQGSLFVYSAVQITCRASAGLRLDGCLLAPQLDLRDLEISYCDEAVLKQLDLLPAELLQVAPTFDLQWLELTPRR